MQGMARLGVVLSPWPALALGMVLLSLAQWWTAQAPAAVLAQMLAGDALLLPRAVLVWAAVAWPVLFLPQRVQHWALALLGTLSLLALAGLEVYFSVAGVPLGRDLFAYSWQELRTTVAGAQVAWPWPMLVALALGLLVLWVSLMRMQPAWLVQARGQAVAGMLGLCVAGSGLLPLQLADAQADRSALASNRLGFFVGDVLSGQTTALPAASGEYPFEHAETTPDTLGPLLDLDPKAPPNLVLFVVEGLGRSFSGPGARLGSFTPFLDELAGRSLYWENFLATQGRTFAVLPSVLGSLPFGPYGQQAIAHDNLLSLLQAQGYSLRYFTGTDLAFDQQGAFLAGSGVQAFWSEKDYVAPAQKVSEWGYPDGDLMEAVVARPMPRAPSVTVVQTMSMHTPFTFPEIAAYRQKVEARLQLLGVPAAERDPYLRQKDIYASILYTDEALRRFFARIQGKSEWQNTVFVITGDHRLPEIAMASRIERYHVPLIVHSPLLRAPQRIKALSSHFDIAPSLLAMLSHRYGMPMPQRVHWMGAGLDVHPQWRNLHSLPLKQTKTELSDYVSGEYYLAQDRLMSLQDGLVTASEANPAVAQAMRAEFAGVRANLAALERSDRLVPESARQARAVYSEAGRTLEPGQRARQIEGVVVSGVEGRLTPDGRLNAQGVFGVQGLQKSPVFVPLLVLTDAGGRELAEASGQAMTLQPGQSQQVTLNLQPAQLPAGPLFVSLIVSHPETGRPIGKGQYHVPVSR